VRSIGILHHACAAAFFLHHISLQQRMAGFSTEAQSATSHNLVVKWKSYRDLHSPDNKQLSFET